jgi:hypothetical protein
VEEEVVEGEEEEEETDSRSMHRSAERLDPDVAPARIHYV